MGLVDSMGPVNGINDDHFDLITYSFSVFVFQLQNDGRFPTETEIKAMPIRFYQLFKYRVQHDEVNCGIIILLISYIIWSKNLIAKQMCLKEELSVYEFLSAIITNLLHNKKFGNKENNQIFHSKDYESFRLYVAVSILFNRLYDPSLYSTFFETTIYHQPSSEMANAPQTAIVLDNDERDNRQKQVAEDNQEEKPEVCHICRIIHKVFYTHSICNQKICFNCYKKQILKCSKENEYNGTVDDMENQTNYNASLVSLPNRRPIRSWLSLRDTRMYKGNKCPLCASYGTWKVGNMMCQPIYGFAKILIDMEPFFMEVTNGHKCQSMCYRNRCTSQLYTERELKQIGIDDADVDLYNQVDSDDENAN